jgi:predicted Fe-Mo cluster-binding NifX family protein
MIIAIPSSGNTTDSLISERFARCAWFCLYNNETGKAEFIQNTSKDLPGGAGPKVVEFLADKKVTSVYATEVGPKAENLMQKLNIKIVLVDSQKTINQLTCGAIE